MPREPDINEMAFRSMKPTLDQEYPRGRFVAFHGGKVVADAGSFSDLLSQLTKKGVAAQESFVVQAGVDYPERGFVWWTMPVLNPSASEADLAGARARTKRQDFWPRPKNNESDSLLTASGAP